MLRRKPLGKQSRLKRQQAKDTGPASDVLALFRKTLLNTVTYMMQQIEIDTSQALWDWLGAHQHSEESYLLVTWKKSVRDKYVSRDEVLDALLAYGWIDGRRYALDDDRTMQLICRRKQQKWTHTYRARIDKLTKAGLMQPSGLAAVAQAQQNGTWLVNEDIDALLCPPDLHLALRQQNATQWWEAAAPSYKRNLLRWLGSAKKDATRQKRCDEIAKACAEKRKIKNM